MDFEIFTEDHIINIQLITTLIILYQMICVLSREIYFIFAEYFLNHSGRTGNVLWLCISSFSPRFPRYLTIIHTSPRTGSPYSMTSQIEFGPVIPYGFPVIPIIKSPGLNTIPSFLVPLPGFEPGRRSNGF